MILRDGDERLILNMRHDTSSYSNQPHKESINMIDIYNISHEEYLEDFFATNHQSGNPTSSFTYHTDLTSPEEEFKAYLASNSFHLGNDDLVDYSLEEFIDELTLITFPPGNDDLPVDAKSDLQEIEYLLNHDPIEEMDSILEDSVDKNSPDDNLVDTLSEMFTNEHALDFSSPPLWDDNDDELLDLKTCDSVFYEDFSKVDALPSTNNEDKVFNSGILIHGNHFEVTNHVTPDNNVKKTTNASLILEDFNPPLYELPFHKKVPGLGALLLFSSENEEKVFNPGILISKRVHTSLLPELSHRDSKAFKVINIYESPMKMDIRILDVPCLHFYPP
ncbi:hypothetical protein Tco_0615870 [Tanacetum coccineum]